MPSKSKIFSLLITTFLAGGFATSAMADPVCQPEYERLFKISLGTSHPSAKYCGMDCDVPDRKLTDDEYSFMLDCEKAIKGTWTGAPLPEKPAARAVEDIVRPVPSQVSMTTSTNRDTFRFGDPLTPNSEFPFPVIAHGEIWVPDLKWQNLTTMVNVPLWADRDEERPALPLPYDDMLEAGRGQELVDLLIAHTSKSDSGRPELDIFNIYNAGLGGVAKNEAAAWEWFLRAAEKVPDYNKNIGNAYRDGTFGQTPDIMMAAHYWSKGLSRGCHGCGKQLIELHESPPEGVSLPFTEDTHFRYLIFTYDLGEAYVGDKIEQFLKRSGATPEQKALYARALEISLKYPNTTGGLAIALHETYRTGLVLEEMIDYYRTYKSVDWTLSANDLTQWELFGRYRGAAISDLLAWDSSKDEPDINLAAATWLAREAVMAGDISSAPLAAYSYSGIKSFINYGDAFRSTELDPSVGMVSAYMGAAVQAGFASEADSLALQSLSAANGADKCWEESSKGYVGAYSQAKYDDMAQRTLSEARSNGCYELSAEAEALSGGSYSIPENISGFMQRSDQLSAQYRAEREKQQQRYNARKASRAGPDRTNSYIASGGASNAPGSTISSADAYSQSKARVCASSGEKTSFCR